LNHEPAAMQDNHLVDVEMEEGVINGPHYSPSSERA